MAQNNQVKVIDKPDASALGEMVNAELSNQIATAKKYPRDEDASLRLLEKLATKSDAVAEQCMYTLKRTQKNKQTQKEEIVFITGPSIHFMQLLNYCWGNMRAAARIVEEGEKTVTAQGLAYDLQRNNGLLVEIKRGITTSGGYRYGQDMINVTSNAACSIAERNAIEDCIPRVLWWDIYEAVKAKAVGAAQIPEKIQNAVKFFIAKGAKQEDILTAMGVSAVADLGREALEIFIGLRSALKEGSIDAAKIFTPEAAEQRRSLRLVDDGPGDESRDDQPMTPIDVVLGKNNGGDPKTAAAQGPGDASELAPKGSRSKGKAAKAEAGSPAAPAEKPAAGEGDGDGGSSTADPADAEVEAEYARLVADIEAKLDPAKAMSSRKLVNEHRGGLSAVVALSTDEALKARAAKILQDWPAK